MLPLPLSRDGYAQSYGTCSEMHRSADFLESTTWVANSECHHLVFPDLLIILTNSLGIVSVKNTCRLELNNCGKSSSPPQTQIRTPRYWSKSWHELIYTLWLRESYLSRNPSQFLHLSNTVGLCFNDAAKALSLSRSALYERENLFSLPRHKNRSTYARNNYLEPLRSVSKLSEAPPSGWRDICLSLAWTIHRNATRQVINIDTCQLRTN